ncbi:ariadne RING finger [Aspergillus terreus]|uniref:Ariadne RING finger n=1 Tax=Aspergillus terreus TaxID=33178 RepID=A0A5M3YRR2_ASPTE|nr:hypothetical protein ATETN484_0001075000 [Aspergillus terreus]GFF12606.1 ariadne RING finger [Aspergillus terreus]
MDTYKGSSIYSWLAAVDTFEDPPYHGQWADNHPSPNSINPSPYTADGLCFPSNEVSHDFSVAARQQRPTLDVPNGTNAQETQHCYERRPRHKTKSDRYEYKGQASARGSHHSSSKPRKRLSRARKHTINDHFHASNVPAKRLTVRLLAKIPKNKRDTNNLFKLPSCTPSGIFGKGKASSPVRTGLQKHPPAPAQGFSEVNFLSHHLPQDNFETACVYPYAPEKYGAEQSRKERTPAIRLAQDSLYQNLSSQFEDNNESPDMRTLLQSSVIQCHELKHPDLDNCQILHRGGLDITKSDSDRNDKGEATQTPSDLYESYTKQLLDFDLDAQPTELDPVAEDLTLERLEEILKERVRTWDQSTKGVPESEDQSQGPDCRKRIRSSSIHSESDASQSHKKQRMLSPSPVETMAATEGFRAPSHDFDLYPQASSVGDVHIMDQQQALFETMSFFPDLEGPSATARSEVGLLDGASDVEKRLSRALLLDSTEEICPQTFLAAYSMIMRDTDGCFEPQSPGSLSHEGSIWKAMFLTRSKDFGGDSSFIGSVGPDHVKRPIQASFKLSINADLQPDNLGILVELVVSSDTTAIAPRAIRDERILLLSAPKIDDNKLKAKRHYSVCKNLNGVHYQVRNTKPPFKDHPLTMASIVMAVITTNKALDPQYIQIASHHALRPCLFPFAIKMSPRRRPRKLTRRNLRQHTSRPENTRRNRNVRNWIDRVVTENGIHWGRHIPDRSQWFTGDIETELLNIELLVAQAMMHDNASLPLNAPDPSRPDRQQNPEEDAETAFLLAPDGNGEVSLYAQMATLRLAARRQNQQQQPQPQPQLEHGDAAQPGAGEGVNHGNIEDQAGLAGMGAQFDTGVDGN